MKVENSFILVPGIGKKTEEKLWKKGITHWEELFSSDEFCGGRWSKCTDFLQKADRNLEKRNIPFFKDKLPKKCFWRLYRNFEDDALFFDIETTGLSKQKNQVTTVSFYKDGETWTLVQGKDLNSENLREAFEDSSLIVTFNGKRFDKPFLEENFDVNIANPHLDLMYLGKRVGLSGGLKAIEEELGVEREINDVDGKEAVKLWKEYKRKEKQEALEKLIEYNKIDARNLEVLLEKVHSRLRREVFEPFVD